MYEFNFPHERTVFGKKLFPTLTARLDWDFLRPLPKVMGLGPPGRPGIAMNLKTEVIGPYNEEDLLSPLTQPESPLTMDYNTIESFARATSPIEAPDITEWMMSAHACQLIIEGMEQEYGRAGSSVVGDSDDPYIPGLAVSDVSFRSERGTTITERGNAQVVTPRGNYNVPVPGKAAGIFSDHLSWGAVLEAWRVQWTACLLKWQNLTTNPQRRIRFGNFRGLVAPQFIAHELDKPLPINFVKMNISSNTSQTLVVRYRETSDYTQTITTVRPSLASGQNEVTFNLIILPYVPKMVVEIQPEDDTNVILDSYSVSSMP